jgi:hypothetical protein
VANAGRVNETFTDPWQKRRATLGKKGIKIKLPYQLLEKTPNTEFDQNLLISFAIYLSRL